MTLQDALNEIATLNKWIQDLQSKFYVNCVYCGHRFGPAVCTKCNGKGTTGDWHDADLMTCTQCNGTGEGTPVAMADVLKAHIAECPKHPMSALKESLRTIHDLATMTPDETGCFAPTTKDLMKQIKNTAAAAL